MIFHWFIKNRKPAYSLFYRGFGVPSPCILVVRGSTIVFYVNISYWPVQTGYWKVYSMLWEDTSSNGYHNHLLCSYNFSHEVLCCCWYAWKCWNKIWYCHWYSTRGFVRLNIILQKVLQVPKLVLFDGELVGGHF